MDLPHPGIDDIALHDAHDGQVLKAHRLIDQIIALAAVPIPGAAAAAAAHVLPHGGKAVGIDLSIFLQKIEQVRHPGFDLTLRLLGQYHATVRVDDVAVALAVVGMAANHLFQRCIVVADSNAGVGHTGDLDRPDGHGEHDPALTRAYDIAAHAGPAGRIRRRKRAPQFLRLSALSGGFQILVGLIEQVQLAVPPGRFFAVEVAQTGPDGRFVCLLLQAVAPLAQHVPVALREHGKRLVHLLVGLQQVLGALPIELALHIYQIAHNVEKAHHHQERKRSRSPSASPHPMIP